MNNISLIQRLIQGIIVLFIISILSFWIINSVPGDPVELLYGSEGYISAEDRVRISENLGLDQPLVFRYWNWIRNIVVDGNMGVSYEQGRPVSEILKEGYLKTLKLFSISIFVMISLSVLLGVKAGVHSGRVLDRFIRVFSIVFYSIPRFWFAIFCMWLFAVELKILPSGGTSSLSGNDGVIDQIRYMILPVFAWITPHLGAYVCFVQDHVSSAASKYYVTVARANGMKEAKIMVGIIKDSAIPFVNYLGTTIPGFLSGSVVIENIFGWPGVGKLALSAILTRDYPLLMGSVLGMGVMVVVVTFIIDMVSLAINPTLRKQVKL